MFETLRAVLLCVPLATCFLPGHRAAAQEAASDSEVIEDPAPLPVTIGGRDYALDTLVVRRKGDEKLPVALITHGSSPGDPREATMDWLRPWAHDLAHRGWLAVAVMRRGYGASEGEVAENAGSCVSPDVGRYLDAHADDLEAALRSIARRPDADMAHVLAVGDSASGAAVMALAARTSVPIAAVVNVSGGLAKNHRPFQLDPTCAAYESDLVWNFARFGTAAHMPTLWLYAENDSWFRPGLVNRMRAAFTGSGGQAELVMLPPFQDDGHKLFFAPGGMRLVLPELDRFLRANALPTWNEAALAPLLARLPSEQWQSVKNYMRLLPTEKALALAPSGIPYWNKGSKTLKEAQDKALSYCKAQTRAECVLVAENFRLLAEALPSVGDRH